MVSGNGWMRRRFLPVSRGIPAKFFFSRQGESLAWLRLPDYELGSIKNPTFGDSLKRFVTFKRIMLIFLKKSALHSQYYAPYLF